MSVLRSPRSFVPAPDEAAPARAGGGRRGALLRRLAPLALLLAVAAAGWHLGAFHHFTVEGFLERREMLAARVAASYWQALASFVVFYTVVVALSVPGSLILTLSAGFLFGPAVGGVVAIAAATAGATLVFLAAGTLAGDHFRRKIGGGLACYVEGFRRDAFTYLLALRLAPVAPFWLVNLVPAFLAVPTRTFVAATVIGIAPASFAFATIGSGIDSVIAAQKAAKADCLAAGTCRLTLDTGAFLTPGLIAALGALAVVALLPLAVRRICRKSAA